jgi:hypothetical protein
MLHHEVLACSYYFQMINVLKWLSTMSTPSKVDRRVFLATFAIGTAAFNVVQQGQEATDIPAMVSTTGRSSPEERRRMQRVQQLLLPLLQGGRIAVKACPQNQPAKVLEGIPTDVRQQLDGLILFHPQRNEKLQLFFVPPRIEYPYVSCENASGIPPMQHPGQLGLCENDSGSTHGCIQLSDEVCEMLEKLSEEDQQ